MIDGKLYLAGQADFCHAKLYIQAGGFQLYIDGKIAVTGAIDELRAADRLGNIARKITLPNGAIFETKDNNAIDSALSNNNQSFGFMGFVHILERNIAIAIFSIFITVAVVFSGFKWGLPAASHAIAHSLPASANKTLSANVLEFLDDYLFETSTLTEEKQQQIRQHFTQYIVPLYAAEQIPEFNLHFRLWPLGENHSIANALALPSGDIIVTDRFIELIATQDEMDIVLLHEMGHIIERHSLEQVIEISTIAIITSLAFGDVSWVADMGIGVSSFLISSFYSREHESEADLFAYEHGLQAGINPASLGHILARMEHDSATFYCYNDIAGEDCPTITELDDNDDHGFSSYFSTHPSSAERTALAKRYHACFAQDLTNCPATDHK